MAKEPILQRETLQRVAWVVIGSLIMIQIVAYLLNQVFGVGGNIRLGLGFMLLIIAGIVMVTFNLVMRYEHMDPRTSKINFVVILITLGILIFLLINIKAWVPEIFTEAVFDLKSMIGII